MLKNGRVCQLQIHATDVAWGRIAQIILRQFCEHFKNVVIRKKCKFSKNKLFSPILYVLFYKVNRLDYQCTRYLVIVCVFISGCMIAPNAILMNLCHSRGGFVQRYTTGLCLWPCLMRTYLSMTEVKLLRHFYQKSVS